jgi:hypothetical protein
LAPDETIMPSFSLAALTVLELAPPALIDVPQPAAISRSGFGCCLPCQAALPIR